MATINLTYGAYQIPRFRVGQSLRCEWADDDVTVVDTMGRKVAWPAYRPNPAGGGKLLPVLTAGLIEAVQRETVQTIAAVWGVSRWTVCRWRRCLGVPRMNDGTMAIWRRLAAARLSPAARRKGGRAHAIIAKKQARARRKSQ